MLWNKQDPSVSEEAVRAIGWIVVHTENGSKVCPERAMLSTAHLSFWDVKWAVTERGPALVCGKTTLGYLNDERYVPQVVRVASHQRRKPCPDCGNCASEICLVRGQLQQGRRYRVVGMLRELSAGKPGAEGFKDFARVTRPVTSEEARAKLDDFRKGSPHLDPITSAMQLVKDMALRNEETLASFKTWADRVVGTFELIRAVERAMKSITAVDGMAPVEGTEAEVHKRYAPDDCNKFAVGFKNRPTVECFKTAREAAEIIERLGLKLPERSPDGITDMRTVTLCLEDICNLEEHLKESKPEYGKDFWYFTIRGVINEWRHTSGLNQSPSSAPGQATAPPPQPEPPKYGGNLRENIVQSMQDMPAAACECGKILPVDPMGAEVQTIKCACGRETEVSF
jgi:hypothetical protein